MKSLLNCNDSSMLLILKFGGTSVANISRLRRAARRVRDALSRGAQVVAVISAMGRQTDTLLEMAHETSSSPPPRELDAIAATGEQVSSAMLATALCAMNIPARSLSGAQAGIQTDSTHGAARITEIDTTQLRNVLDSGIVPVVAGFQGVDKKGHITTFGRGGSDTTATALGVALQADECLIYTDVSGVYTADPRVCPKARKLDSLHYEEMLEMAALGAQVLHPRAVECAGRGRLALSVLSSFEDAGCGTKIRYSEEKNMEHAEITSVVYNSEEAKITLFGVPDQPGIAAKLFTAIAKLGVDVDMIVQNIGADEHTDMSFTIHRSQIGKTVPACKLLSKKLGARGVDLDEKIAKLSVVGTSLRGHAGVAAKMFSALAKGNINIQMISTSEIKLSVIIDESKVQKAVRLLHEVFGLDAVEDAQAVAAAVA